MAFVSAETSAPQDFRSSKRVTLNPADSLFNLLVVNGDGVGQVSDPPAVPADSSPTLGSFQTDLIILHKPINSRIPASWPVYGSLPSEVCQPCILATRGVVPSLIR
jgi:hypothetical protein